MTLRRFHDDADESRGADEWPQGVGAIRRAAGMPDAIPCEWFVFARLGYDCVGYINAQFGLEPENCYIREVAVLPTQRGAGIGTRLMGAMASWMIENGRSVVLAQPMDGPEEPKRIVWLTELGFKIPSDVERDFGRALLVDVVESAKTMLDS